MAAEVQTNSFLVLEDWRPLVGFFSGLGLVTSRSAPSPPAWGPRALPAKLGWVFLQPAAEPSWPISADLGAVLRGHCLQR